MNPFQEVQERLKLLPENFDSYEAEDLRHILRTLILDTYRPGPYHYLTDWSTELLHQVESDPTYEPLKKLKDKVGGWFIGGSFVAI